ncbi:MAG: CRISPR-associated helicase Cas3' [Gemmatimonadetes bacterium]|nr:CRISPR-associated helicase Cas3' [Gemmatimonadota bacterium]MCY3944469.1 CRISPR-associated helicase Cas3' [Gemmatimonadota bacterium]
MDIANLPWGKRDPTSGLTHRLEHHCADVAACFEALVEEPVLRDRFNRAVGGVGTLDDFTLARLVVFAFLHDLGKVAVGFQFKVGGRRPGAPQPANHLVALFQACQRATVIEGWGLDRLLVWGPGVNQLLHAAVAHHGRPVPESQREHPGTERNWQPFAGYDPIAAGRRMIHQAREWFPKAFEEGRPLPKKPALAHLFAGTLAVADQIGSNEELFAREPDFDPGYIGRARQQAENAVSALGFRRARWASPGCGTNFCDLFDEDWNPRPLQTAVAEAPLAERLLILEAETGSGKTEAAIWRFAKLWRAGLVDGLYFALPTRAAATQLHERVTRVLARVFPRESRFGTVLAVPSYIRRVGDATGRTAEGWEVHWHDNPEDADRLARWSAESARKYLTATAAVGTVDQALLAGLQVKWAHMRGSALARSLLVVDEVHASDAYMTEILRSVLRDHLDVGGHALLMSATLGSEARDGLLALGESRRGVAKMSLKEAVAVPYPLLTSSDLRSPAGERSFAATDYSRQVQMSAHPILTKPAAIAEIAVRDARAGAKVLVIRNTVGGACSVFDGICEAGASDLLMEVGAGPALHHSRFAAEDRHLLDDAVERTLGRERSDGGRIIVGTQTLEQSLDIDADCLITDLCPVDVLLQRIGRVHRHRRPERFGGPSCTVLVPEGDLLDKSLLRHGLGPSRTGGIYRDLRIIEATRRLILNHAKWQLPEMNRRLVEEGTHQERLEVIDAELGEELFVEVDGRAAAERILARDMTLDRTKSFDKLAFVEKDTKVRTRLGDDGPRVRLPEPIPGPFGAPVATFSLPAHVFRGGLPSAESP